MKVLFIKLKHIGDALIMTPALAAARSLWPDARIDALVRGSTEGILKGCLALNNIYTTAVPEKRLRKGVQFMRDVRLINKLRQEKYDWIFELSGNDRGRFMAVAIGAKNLCANTRRKFPVWARPFFNRKSTADYTGTHWVLRDLDLVKTCAGYEGEAPSLQFDRSFADWSWVQGHLKDSPIVLHPVTRWKRKMWPLDKWKLLAQKLSQIAPLVISSGPSAEEIEFAGQIAPACPQRVIVTEGALDWSQMAGLLYSSRMLVSLDTATMHLGAACQIPLVAIFGPGDPVEFGPWQCPSEVVRPPSSALLEPSESVIASIGVEDVFEACQRVLTEKEARV